MARIIAEREPSIIRRHIELDVDEEYRRRYIGTLDSIVKDYGRKYGVPQGIKPTAGFPEPPDGRDLVRYSWVWWEVEL